MRLRRWRSGGKEDGTVVVVKAVKCPITGHRHVHCSRLVVPLVVNTYQF
jgi:hypothetical protein